MLFAFFKKIIVLYSTAKIGLVEAAAFLFSLRDSPT